MNKEYVWEFMKGKEKEWKEWKAIKFLFFSCLDVWKQMKWKLILLKSWMEIYSFIRTLLLYNFFNKHRDIIFSVIKNKIWVL